MKKEECVAPLSHFYLRLLTLPYAFMAYINYYITYNIYFHTIGILVNVVYDDSVISNIEMCDYNDFGLCALNIFFSCTSF